MRPPLSPSQRAVYETIQALERRFGKPPTLRRIRLEMGLKSVATVHKHVTHMAEKGYCRMTDDGIELFPIEATNLSQYPR